MPPKSLPLPCFWRHLKSRLPVHTHQMYFPRTKPHCLARRHSPKNPHGLHPDGERTPSILLKRAWGLGPTALRGEGPSVRLHSHLGPKPSRSNRILHEPPGARGRGRGPFQSAVYTRADKNCPLQGRKIQSRTGLNPAAAVKAFPRPGRSVSLRRGVTKPRPPRGHE